MIKDTLRYPKKIIKGLSMALAIALAVPVLSLGASDTIAQAAEGVSIYELQNQKTWEFLYTPDRNEVNTLISMPDWTSNGVKWVAPKSGDAVYRMYNPGGFHLYTTDKNEVKILKKNGWILDNNGNPLFYSGGDINVLRLYGDFEEPRAFWPQGGHRLVVNLDDYDTVNGAIGEGTKLHAIGPGEKCDQYAVKSSAEDYVKTWTASLLSDYYTAQVTKQGDEYIFTVNKITNFGGSGEMTWVKHTFPCKYDKNRDEMYCDGKGTKESFIFYEGDTKAYPDTRLENNNKTGLYARFILEKTIDFYGDESEVNLLLLSDDTYTNCTTGHYSVDFAVKCGGIGENRFLSGEETEDFPALPNGVKYF